LCVEICKIKMELEQVESVCARGNHSLRPMRVPNVAYYEQSLKFFDGLLRIVLIHRENYGAQYVRVEYPNT
jgi:hypothetical protein